MYAACTFAATNLIVDNPHSHATVLVRSVYWDNPVLRAGRWERLNLVLENMGSLGTSVIVDLDAPPTVDVQGARHQRIWLGPSAKLKSIPEPENYHIVEATWLVRRAEPGSVRLGIKFERANAAASVLEVTGDFGKPKPVEQADYVPPPQAASTPYLVGAFYFPGWAEGKHFGWSRIAPYPDRKPLLGWYDDGSPAVADWEIKWALEHGISFFMYDWYREHGNEGRPVIPRSDHALRDGLFNARYRNLFKFCIMFENSRSGITGPRDFLSNVLAFWIKNYFSRPNYLIIHNKPVIAIYQWDKFAKHLGLSQAEQADTLEMMNQKLRTSGFDGVWLLVDHGNDGFNWIDPSQQFVYRFSYTGGYESLSGGDNLPPRIPTVSTGWDDAPWGGRGPDNRLTPDQFQNILVKAKKTMDALPADHLGHRMLLIDNWNEWGEGHYVAPNRKYGFGYLDAIRNVFTDAPRQHKDLVPEDVGLGPYETRYRDAMSLQVSDADHSEADQQRARPVLRKLGDTWIRIPPPDGITSDPWCRFCPDLAPGPDVSPAAGPGK